jgi:replicative DNA helicase
MNDFEELMNYTAEQLIPPDGAPIPGTPAPIPAAMPTAEPPADQSGAQPAPAPQQQPTERQQLDFTRYCVGNRLAALRQKFEDGDKVKPISTGFPRLDDIFIGGMRAGLYVMSAVPSWGKSAFCGQLMDTAAAAGRNVLYFALEMSTEELVARSISREMYLDGLIDNHTERAKSATQIMYGTRCGEWSDAERSALDRAYIRYQMYADCVYIFEDVHTIEGLQGIVKEFIKQTPDQPPPLVILDYLQIMRMPADAKSTVDGLDRIATDLKQLSRDAQCPLFVLSSMNRDSYKGNGGLNSNDSGLASGRGSGGIEFSADVLMLGTWLKAVTGDGKYSDYEEKKRDPRQVVIRVLKNRAGRNGQVEFTYRSRVNHFTDEEPPKPPQFGSVVDAQGRPLDIKRASTRRRTRRKSQDQDEDADD